MDIVGKTAIVTGASSGIGAATAKLFVAAGVGSLVLVDVDEEGLSRTAGELSGTDIMQYHCDVTCATELEALYNAVIDRFERVDIVFNNAGIVSGPPPFPDTDIKRMKQVVDIDLTSVIQSSAIAIRIMRQQGSGVIINTASTGGLNPYLADAPYAAAKAGVIMFSRSCKDLHTSDNIRVNAVCPGVTETPILEKTGGGKRPDWLAPIMEHIRILSADDIGKAVMNIIADDSMAGEYVVVQNEPK